MGGLADLKWVSMCDSNGRYKRARVRRGGRKVKKKKKTTKQKHKNTEQNKRWEMERKE